MGFIFGMIFVCFLGLLIYFTIMTLVKSALLTRASTLQQLVNICFGRTGEIGLNIVLFVTAWTSMAAYTVIIGDVLPDILHHAIGGDNGRDSLSPFVNWIISRRSMVLFTSWLVLFPISLAKSLAKLARFSLIALAGITIIVASILASSPGLINTTFAGTSGITFINISGIPGGISILCFAFVCHHNGMDYF
jgi:sodium-coupled neutral amino acid transporter 11